MEIYEVNSSRCKAAAYTEDGMIIVYNNDKKYLYPTITKHQFNDFLSSESKGRWIQENIVSKKLKYKKYG